MNTALKVALAAAALACVSSVAIAQDARVSVEPTRSMTVRLSAADMADPAALEAALAPAIRRVCAATGQVGVAAWRERNACEARARAEALAQAQLRVEARRGRAFALSAR